MPRSTIVLVSCGLLVALSCSSQKRQISSLTSSDWHQLLAATADGVQAKNPAVTALLGNAVASGSAMWPVDTFLKAEVLRLRGDATEARAAYRSLVQWAAGDPYNDGWGADGLAVVGLWRWVELGGTAGADENEVAAMADCAQKLQATRIARGMFHQPLLAALPQVQEETLRGLAQLMWVTGRKVPAESLFLDYLQVARTEQRNQIEEQIWQELVRSGQASEDRLRLLVGSRLNTLGQKDTAASIFRSLQESSDPQVRSHAFYQLALIERLARNREAELDSLNSALEDAGTPELRQQILFERAKTYNRPGPGRNSELFKSDMHKVVEQLPQGDLAADALYELARDAEREGDSDQALKYFSHVQERGPGSGAFELSYYHAFLTLYTRSRPGDSEQAKQLLLDLLKKKPSAEIRSAALFWLGRLAEERNDGKQAVGYYRQVVESSPYDYYGIRSSMHLNLGPQARNQLLPDDETAKDLARAYKRPASAGSAPVGGSAYSHRVYEGLSTGLYQASLESEARLHGTYPAKRVQDLTSSELESSGELSNLALFLAFRQDVQAAAASEDRDRLPLALAIGESAGDWQQAISLCPVKTTANSQSTVSQVDPGLLSAAYPTAFPGAFRTSGASYQVPPELLYAMARRESLFYPSALSSAGALGLFQFMPGTFNQLDAKWHLLTSTGTKSFQEYVLDPSRSIQLGARHFNEDLLPAYKPDVLPAVAEHNLGQGLMRGWYQRLRLTDKRNDVEYQVETIPDPETRKFVRGVTADFAIAASTNVLSPSH